LRRSLRSHFCAKRAQGKLPLPAALVFGFKVSPPGKLKVLGRQLAIPCSIERKSQAGFYETFLIDFSGFHSKSWLVAARQVKKCIPYAQCSHSRENMGRFNQTCHSRSVWCIASASQTIG